MQHKETGVLRLDNDIGHYRKSVVLINLQFVLFYILSWVVFVKCEDLFLDLPPDIVKGFLLSAQCHNLGHLSKNLH